MSKKRNSKMYIEKDEDGGIILIGDEIDSFQKFYEAFRDEIIIPIVEELPGPDEIQERISRALRKKEVLKEG